MSTLMLGVNGPKTFMGLDCGNSCWAQEDIVVEEGPLIDQQPFDLIHLTAGGGGETYKVFPIQLPNRQLPENPSPNSKIEVVLKQFPDRRYEIAWKWIDRIELYEEMISEEAKKRLSEKDYVGAFQNLSYLMRNFPDTPRMESLRLDFLFSSLTTSYSNNQLEQTLSTLEELRESAPEFRAESVGRALNNVSRALLERYEKSGDFASANRLIERLESQHGPLDVAEQWRQRVTRMSEAKLEEGRKHLQEQQYREAYTAALASLSLSPDLASANEFLSELTTLYPILRVGVMQRSNRPDSTSLMDWSARRCGPLVERPIFQFLQIGNEGGNYEFALGRHRVSDDRRSLQLTLNAKDLGPGQISRFAQWIVDRAEPGNSSYEPEWAVIFDSVESRGANLLNINLRRPHVLPHSLMQWQVPADMEDFGLAGPYEKTVLDSGETVFSLQSQPKESGLPSEIVEIFYRDARQAINDLARGHIDAVDQLYPSDARKLSTDSRFRVFSYSLPSTHLLVPVSEHAYLSKDKFRRALLYATDREGMLRGELLSSADSRDGRLISGPFPLGDSDSDPLNYAYNRSIPPLRYDPQLAKLLVTICRQEFELVAKKTGEAPPELEKLIVGCPDFEFARVAAQAMIQQWAMIGIEAELMEIPSWDQTELVEQCDLIYLMTTLWEPATDIQRLLGGTGIAASDNPFIVQGLGRLRDSLNWREVRTSLQDLHRLIAYHLPVLPLWQVTDRFVVRRGIAGVSNRPVSLYQNLADWRLELVQPAKD